MFLSLLFLQVFNVNSIVTIMNIILIIKINTVTVDTLFHTLIDFHFSGLIYFITHLFNSYN